MEATVRLCWFVGVFAVVALAETCRPRRAWTTSKARRWVCNLGVTVLNATLVRVMGSAGAIGVAAWAQERGWGLLNHFPLPYPVVLVVAVLVLDLAIYLQHVVFHAVPLLWRFHMIHHTDLDFDVTTGVRFHPIEILLSLAIKMTVVALLGPPKLGVLVFEVLLNATSLFNHGNMRLPARLDRVLRWIVVTPDMHRVHHSIEVSETNSNYGFNLPWWDRLFGTYRAQPAAGHEAMTIGLKPFRNAKGLTFMRLLALPFRKQPAGSGPPDPEARP